MTNNVHLKGFRSEACSLLHCLSRLGLIAFMAIALSGLMSPVAAQNQAATFADYFNRADGDPGNGWRIMAGSPRQASVINKKLTSYFVPYCCSAHYALPTGVVRVVQFERSIDIGLKYRADPQRHYLRIGVGQEPIAETDPWSRLALEITHWRNPDDGVLYASIDLRRNGVMLGTPSTRLPSRLGGLIDVQARFERSGRVVGVVRDDRSGAETPFDFQFEASQFPPGNDISIVFPMGGYEPSRAAYIDNFVVYADAQAGPDDPTQDSFKLTFPLSGGSAYGSNVSAVLDQGGTFNTKNGVVTLFNGVSASCDHGVRTYNIRTGEATVLSETDRATACSALKQNSATAGYLYEFRTQFADRIPFPPFDEWFSYDGHSGYDYPAGAGSQIVAAAAGILCVATPLTTSGSQLWRNPKQCPYGVDHINGSAGRSSAWDAFHTFYIVHPNTGYTTWYLHAEQLDSSIQASVLSSGYVEVAAGQPVGTVGGCCFDFGRHLHFEVRKGDRQSIDPYGSGGAPSLWR